MIRMFAVTCGIFASDQDAAYINNMSYPPRVPLRALCPWPYSDAHSTNVTIVTADSVVAAQKSDLA